jgi:hypothetical protein
MIIKSKNANKARYPLPEISPWAYHELRYYNGEGALTAIVPNPAGTLTQELVRKLNRMKKDAGAAYWRVTHANGVQTNFLEL